MSEKELNEIAKQLKIMNGKIDLLIANLLQSRIELNKLNKPFKPNIGSTGDYPNQQQSEK